MKKSITTILVFSMLAFVLSPVSSDAAGPAAADLLSTTNFAILSKTGITNTGSHLSNITGDIGASPITGAAMDNIFCSEITGNIYSVDAAYVGSGDVTCLKGNPPSANKTLIDNAILDVGTIYADLAGRTLPDGTELYAGNIGGHTFTPGLYKWGSDVLISSDVTLSGSANDVWIFQIAGNLATSSAGSIATGAKVQLIGGARAANVFWQVGGVTGATLGTYSTFNGNILSAKAINLQTGAVLNGRALAQSEVTLDANPVTLPTATVGVLKVDSIDTINAISIADGTFAHGWKYVFNITVPTNETNFSIKFEDWHMSTGPEIIPVANNMRISSAQADNAGATVLVTDANTYTTPTLNMITDLDPAIDGIQVEIVVEVATPTNTVNGDYVTNYGVKTQ